MMFNGLDFEIADEFLGEYPDDHADLRTGELQLDLDFAEGVEYDLDHVGDGELIIQYWRREEVADDG